MGTVPPNTLAERVKWERKTRPTTLRHLAAELLVSAQFLQDVEEGRREISDERVPHWAQVLHISPDYLFYILGRLPIDLRGRWADDSDVSALFRLLRSAAAKND